MRPPTPQSMQVALAQMISSLLPGLRMPAGITAWPGQLLKKDIKSARPLQIPPPMRQTKTSPLQTGPPDARRDHGVASSARGSASDLPACPEALARPCRTHAHPPLRIPHPMRQTTTSPLQTGPPDARRDRGVASSARGSPDDPPACELTFQTVKRESTDIRKYAPAALGITTTLRAHVLKCISCWLRQGHGTAVSGGSTAGTAASAGNLMSARSIFALAATMPSVMNALLKTTITNAIGRTIPPLHPFRCRSKPISTLPQRQHAQHGRVLMPSATSLPRHRRRFLPRHG